MIYVTGDLHGDISSLPYFCEVNHTTTDDILVVLGDAGFNYYGGKKDRELKEEASKLPITLLCVHGNHEIYPLHLPTYAQTDFCEGRVFVEPQFPNLLFTVNGSVYNLNGSKAIAIGGAYSVDKYYRIEKGYRWFEHEQSGLLERDNVEASLDKIGWSVDYVFTHTAPRKYEPIEWFLGVVDQSTVDNSTEDWLDSIENRLEYKQWFCGHYHGNKDIDKISFLFNGYKVLDPVF